MPPTEFGRSEGPHVNTEKFFPYVPDPLHFRDCMRYAEDYRALIDLGNLDPAQSRQERILQRGPYFMYRLSTRYTRKAGLEWIPNEYFLDIEGGRQVHGNVFIFKVNQKAFERGVVELRIWMRILLVMRLMERVLMRRRASSGCRCSDVGDLMDEHE